MTENTFYISLRFISEEHDFQELIPEMNNYKIHYSKKGERVTKNSNFKARANVLVVNDCYIGNSIDEEGCTLIVKRLIPIMESLSVIDTNDLIREMYITGVIENQQFGFMMNLDVIKLLADNKYALSFSGTSYL